MAARKSTRVHRKYKTKYRVTNWREYESGLRRRGDVTVWFSEEAIEAWTPPKNGRRGGQPQYSKLAILTALTLRVVFRLPLRQTEGFLDSLLRLMALNLKAPDHTTLSRRNKDVDVPAPTRVHDGPTHLIVDCTGLKISGAGEWHAHRHKSSKAPRPSALAKKDPLVLTKNDPVAEQDLFHSNGGRDVWASAMSEASSVVSVDPL